MRQSCSDVLHAAVVTPRGDRVRVISLRRASRRERRDLRKHPSRPDDENPEWTAAEIRAARPLLEVLPPETAAAIRRYRGQRGPQKAPTKELVSLRVDRDVVAAYRASGPGWQARANEALRAYARTRLGKVTRRTTKSAGPSRSRHG